MNQKVPRLVELSSLCIAQNFHPDETIAIKESFNFEDKDAEYFIENIPINLALTSSIENNSCESFWNHIVEKCSKFVCYKARIEKLENTFSTDFSYECLDVDKIWQKKKVIIINMLFNEALYKISNKRVEKIPLHYVLGTNCIHSKDHFCLFEWLNLLSGSITKLKLNADTAEILAKHKAFLNNITNSCVDLELKISNNMVDEFSSSFQNILFIISHMIHHNPSLKSITVPYLSFSKMRKILVLLNYKFADTTIYHNECCCKLNRHELNNDSSESYLFEESYFYDSDSETNSQKQKNENKRKMSDSRNSDHQTKKPKQDLFSKFENEIFSSSSSSNVTNHQTQEFLEEQNKIINMQNKEFMKDNLRKYLNSKDSDDDSCSLCFPNNMPACFESQMHSLNKSTNLSSFNLLKLQLTVANDDITLVLQLVSKLKSLKELDLEIYDVFSYNTTFDLKHKKLLENKPIVDVIKLVSHCDCALTTLKLEGFKISVDQLVDLSQKLLGLVQCRSYQFELLELNRCDFISGVTKDNYQNTSQNVTKESVEVVKVLSFNNNILKNQSALKQILLTAITCLKPETLVSFQNKLSFYESSSNMANIYILTECLSFYLTNTTVLCSLKNIHVDFSQPVEMNDVMKMAEVVQGLGINLLKIYHPPYPYYSSEYKKAFSQISCLKLERCNFIDFEYSSIIHKHTFQAELGLC